LENELDQFKQAKERDRGIIEELQKEVLTLKEVFIFYNHLFFYRP
jgi:hypothetical protein